MLEYCILRCTYNQSVITYELGYSVDDLQQFVSNALEKMDLNEETKLYVKQTIEILFDYKDEVQQKKLLSQLHPHIQKIIYEFDENQLDTCCVDLLKMIDISAKQLLVNTKRHKKNWLPWSFLLLYQSIITFIDLLFTFSKVIQFFSLINYQLVDLDTNILFISQNIYKGAKFLTTSWSIYIVGFIVCILMLFTNPYINKSKFEQLIDKCCKQNHSLNVFSLNNFIKKSIYSLFQFILQFCSIIVSQYSSTSDLSSVLFNLLSFYAISDAAYIQSYCLFVFQVFKNLKNGFASFFISMLITVPFVSSFLSHFFSNLFFPYEFISNYFGAFGKCATFQDIFEQKKKWTINVFNLLVHVCLTALLAIYGRMEWIVSAICIICELTLIFVPFIGKLHQNEIVKFINQLHGLTRIQPSLSNGQIIADHQSACKSVKYAAVPYIGCFSSMFKSPIIAIKQTNQIIWISEIIRAIMIIWFVMDSKRRIITGIILGIACCHIVFEESLDYFSVTQRTHTSCYKTIKHKKKSKTANRITDPDDDEIDVDEIQQEGENIFQEV
ncbi:Hypothetical_protein [Hexamita inflata]|uniref:Hypothetical_protein n=1 Tax=Hexamita inflata TaxID=28002 RepID=A0AA86RCY3_9EUKA|nr:Hypothetical protein HINF_LOCUS62915 [Hexamita inflata]